MNCRIRPPRSSADVLPLLGLPRYRRGLVEEIDQVQATALGVLATGKSASERLRLLTGESNESGGNDLFPRHMQVGGEI